jgi:hypothetical protein
MTLVLLRNGHIAQHRQAMAAGAVAFSSVADALFLLSL